MEVRARRFLGTALDPSSLREGFARNRAALADPITRRLVFADFASMVGDAVVLTAMPFAVFAVGGSAQWVGLVLAAQGAGLVVALPLAGVYGDRLDRRSVMVAADLVRVVSQGSIAVLLLVGSASVELLLLSQLVHGLAQGAFQPAAAAIVPDVIEDDSVQAAFGLKTVARGAAGSVGPALGALAIAFVGPGLAMAADAGTFVVSAVAVWGVPRRPKPEEEGERSSRFRGVHGRAAFVLKAPLASLNHDRVLLCQRFGRVPAVCLGTRCRGGFPWRGRRVGVVAAGSCGGPNRWGINRGRCATRTSFGGGYERVCFLVRAASAFGCRKPDGLTHGRNGCGRPDRGVL